MSLATQLVSGAPRLVLGLVTGMLDRDRAVTAGVQLVGRADVLDRLQQEGSAQRHAAAHGSP